MRLETPDKIRTLQRKLYCKAKAEPAFRFYGSRNRAYRANDHHVCGRVRHFLSRRHKVPSRGTERFPSDLIFGGLGVLALDYRRGPYNQTSRKAGYGKSARPV